jgi:hypothetical protein
MERAAVGAGEKNAPHPFSTPRVAEAAASTVAGELDTYVGEMDVGEGEGPPVDKQDGDGSGDDNAN